MPDTRKYKLVALLKQANIVEAVKDLSSVIEIERARIGALMACADGGQSERGAALPPVARAPLTSAPEIPHCKTEAAVAMESVASVGAASLTSALPLSGGTSRGLQRGGAASSAGAAAADDCITAGDGSGGRREDSAASASDGRGEGRPPALAAADASVDAGAPLAACETPQLARLGHPRSTGSAGGTRPPTTMVGQSGGGSSSSAFHAVVPSGPPPPPDAASGPGSGGTGRSDKDKNLARRSSRLSASAGAAGSPAGQQPGRPAASSTAGVFIMGTGLLEPDKAAIIKVVELLTIAGVEAAYLDAFDGARLPTHVVTQTAKTPGRDAVGAERMLRSCKRTLKMTQGMLCGAWVLDAAWLQESVKAGALLPEAPFEVEVDLKSVPQARARAERRPTHSDTCSSYCLSTLLAPALQPTDWFGPAKARRLVAERKVGRGLSRCVSRAPLRVCLARPHNRSWEGAIFRQQASSSTFRQWLSGRLIRCRPRRSLVCSASEAQPWPKCRLCRSVFLPLRVISSEWFS